MRDLRRRTELEQIYEVFLNESYEDHEIDGKKYKFGTLIRLLEPEKFRDRVSSYLISGCDELTIDQLTDQEVFAYNALTNDIFYAIKPEIQREFEQMDELENVGME